MNMSQITAEKVLIFEEKTYTVPYESHANHVVIFSH
jgi:hypothetical protein